MIEADTTESSEPPGSFGASEGNTGGPGAVPAPRVELADPQGLLGPEAGRWLEVAAARAVAAMGCGGEVRIRIVDDAEISRAHEEYLGEAGTTDVITFDLSDPEAEPLPEAGGRGEAGGQGEALAGFPGRMLDTDLLICIDEAARQGAARGHTPEQELLLYTVHGLLHCLGHDDHDDEVAARMHRAEDRILEAIGIGATYSRPERGAGGGAGAATGKEQS